MDPECPHGETGRTCQSGQVVGRSSGHPTGMHTCFPKILALKANLRLGKISQILNEMKKIDLDRCRGDHVFINILRPPSGWQETIKRIRQVQIRPKSGLYWLLAWGNYLEFCTVNYSWINWINSIRTMYIFISYNNFLAWYPDNSHKCTFIHS